MSSSASSSPLPRERSEVDLKVDKHLPPSNEGYGQQEYWDERYREEETFDWFVGYSKIRDLVLRHVDVKDSVLNLGCGNSSMPMEMWDDGFRDITNLDYSPVVIETMAGRTGHMAGLKWVEGDVTRLSEDFEGGSFDVVMEKGTLDALLVSEKDPWCYSEGAEVMLDGILGQVSHLLRPGGRFISITFCQPHFRLPFYANPDYRWSVTVETVGDGFHYFCYVLTKGEPLKPSDYEYRARYLERKSRSWSSCAAADDDDGDDDDDEDFLFRVDETCQD